MIYTNMFIKSLHISWLRRIIKQSDTLSWCSMSNINFEKLFNFGSGYIKTIIKNMKKKTFWRDTLNEWTAFCDCLNIEKAQDILDSPLWYKNKIINRAIFCVKYWYKKGIRQVADPLDEQGNIYECEAFKTRFGLRGTFLEFQSLIRKFQIDEKLHWMKIKISQLLID